jgi:hypothetical protein
MPDSRASASAASSAEPRANVPGSVIHAARRSSTAARCASVAVLSPPRIQSKSPAARRASSRRDVNGERCLGKRSRTIVATAAASRPSPSAIKPGCARRRRARPETQTPRRAPHARAAWPPRPPRACLLTPAIARAGPACPDPAAAVCSVSAFPHLCHIVIARPGQGCSSRVFQNRAAMIPVHGIASAYHSPQRNEEKR